MEATLSYTDPTYGYSFEYPASWYLSSSKESGGITSLYSYDPTTLSPEEAVSPLSVNKLKAEFVVLGNPEGLYLDSWIAERRESGGFVEVESRFPVTIGGTAGIAETANLAEGPATQYFIGIGADVYVISMYPSDSLLLKEFHAVLTSFKF
jgi:hypothetical protein